MSCGSASGGLEQVPAKRCAVEFGDRHPHDLRRLEDDVDTGQRHTEHGADQKCPGERGPSQGQPRVSARHRSAQAIPREQRKAEQQHEVQVLDEPQGIGGHARQVGGASADGKAEVPRHRVIIRPDGAVLYAISTGFQRMMQLGAQRLADDLDLQMLDRHGRVAVDHCQLQA